MSSKNTYTSSCAVKSLTVAVIITLPVLIGIILLFLNSIISEQSTLYNTLYPSSPVFSRGISTSSSIIIVFSLKLILSLTTGVSGSSGCSGVGSSTVGTSGVFSSSLFPHPITNKNILKNNNI